MRRQRGRSSGILLSGSAVLAAAEDRDVARHSSMASAFARPSRWVRGSRFTWKRTRTRSRRIETRVEDGTLHVASKPRARV